MTENYALARRTMTMKENKQDRELCTGKENTWP